MRSNEFISLNVLQINLNNLHVKLTNVHRLDLTQLIQMKFNVFVIYYKCNFKRLGLIKTFRLF